MNFSWIRHLFFCALAFITLVLIFLYEVIVSSCKVLWWIYTKGSKIESEIFQVELSVSKAWQKIVIAHFVTLTPGTVSIEFQSSQTLLVHCLDRSSLEDTLSLIETKLEPLLRRMEWRR